MCLDAGSARPSSGRVRFPSRAEDEEELLLEVSPFPEERLASSLSSKPASLAGSLASSLTSSPASQPRQVASSAVSPQTELGSLARPLSLEASLHGVVAGQQKPRLHLPRTSDQRSLGRVSGVTKPRPRPQAAEAVRPAFEDAAPPPLVAKTKVITNPLLQKLFNRNSLHLAATTVRPAPTTTTARPAPRQSEAATPRAVTRQPRPQTQRTTTTRPPTLPTQQQQQQQTLFDQIKNRINNNNAQQRQQEEQSEEDLMNALIQRRVEEELQRRRDQEAARLDQERRRLLDQTRLSAEAAARLARYEALVAAAGEAVTARVSGATDRASPAVWAATRALRSFVGSRSGDTAAEAAHTPDKVLAAVAQLTSFLGRDQGEVSVEAEEVSRAQLETFMRGEGRGQSEAALANVDLQKVVPEPAASPEFPLLRQFEASLASKQVTLNIGSERGVRQPPELSRTSASDLAQFSFSTLPV